ncbi:MAG: D-amino acid dehydrogenase [Rhodospirillaceae bacterium]|nr:D-amino acid dehydrogenase [Rhodospirillaceae bacterium]
MNDGKDIIILGAGVIGVTSAYYLARAGHRVTVIDRQPGPGLETSYANGGQISASHAVPWAMPSTLPKIIKWLGRADAPLKIRLRADPALLAWCVRFLANCTSGRAAVNMERMLRIALYSRQALAEIECETAMDYQQRSCGILHIYGDPSEYKQACLQAGQLSDIGLENHPLDGFGCVHVEPALASARNRGLLVGGIHTPGDGSGDAHMFTAQLADIAAGLGVEFIYDSPIRRLIDDGGRIAGVETETEIRRGDAYVVALASYSPLLLRPLGIRLPIIPAKGYSVTLPLTADTVAPTVSLIQDEKKLVYSRLGQRLRVAGTADLTGYDLSIDDRRARMVLDAALELFPGAGNSAEPEFWAGLRPKTPDSVPVIGPTRYDNLFLNTGHGTLGWTMACGSGRFIADMISGKTPKIDMLGLGIERFK